MGCSIWKQLKTAVVKQNSYLGNSNARTDISAINEYCLVRHPGSEKQSLDTNGWPTDLNKVALYLSCNWLKQAVDCSFLIFYRSPEIE